MGNIVISHMTAIKQPWVVVSTMTPWDEIPRLRHQVTRALAHHYRILYIEFPTNWRRKRREQWSQPETNITVWRPSSWFHLPWRLTIQSHLLWRFETHWFERAFKQALCAREITPVALINFDHRHQWILDHRFSSRLIYICNDDFSLFTPNVEMATRVRRQIHETARSADVCLVTSERYLELLNVGPKARVFSPGHDLPISAPPSVKSYNGGDDIKVGFMGYIDRKLGMSYIEQVAHESDMEWHIIGPVADLEVGKRLSSLKSVTLYEPRTGVSLLEWLQSMDVLAIPYELSERWSNSVSTPNKTFAYFAAGKPIVVSSLPTFDGWGDHNVYHAHNPEEFVAQIRAARLNDSSDKGMRRIDIARKFSWEKRVSVLIDLIENQEAVAYASS